MKKILLAIGGVLFLTTAVNAQEAVKPELRAKFTSGIENREPVDEMLIITKDEGRVSFFTEIKERAGETIVHVWKNGDVEFFKKSFDVKGPRWRVWSSVSTDHFDVGDEATVNVTNSDGDVLFTKTIKVEKE